MEINFDYWKSLSDNEVSWRSCAKLTKNDLVTTEPKADIAAISTPELVHSMDNYLNGLHHVEVNEKWKGWRVVLQIASISIAQSLVVQETLEEVRTLDLRISSEATIVQKSSLQIWIQHSQLLSLIASVFDERSESITSLKKLALDLGFVILSHAVDFHHPSLGFQAPLQHYHHELLSLLGKYLESFMVTDPTHYPFMPAEFFARIHWPLDIRESCSGKVHSLIDYLENPVGDMVIEEENEDEISSVEGDEEHKTKKDASKGNTGEAGIESAANRRYCNYEVVARRQPWRGKFTSLQLLQMVHQFLETRDKIATEHTEYISNVHSTEPEIPPTFQEPAILTNAQCESLLSLYNDVFQRIRLTDPALLYRDTQQKTAFYKGTHCHCCDRPVSTLLGRLNPFSRLLFGRRTNEVRSKSKDHDATDSDKYTVSTEATTSASSTNYTASVEGRATVQQKHHCRLCLQVICSDCSASALYLQRDRICLHCHEALSAMHLMDLQEKPKKAKKGSGSLGLFFQNSESRKAATSTEEKVNERSQAAINLLSGLPPPTSSTHAVDTLFHSDDDDENGICCSMLLPESLRSWRDTDDGYESA